MHSTAGEACVCDISVFSDLHGVHFGCRSVAVAVLLRHQCAAADWSPNLLIRVRYSTFILHISGITTDVATWSEYMLQMGISDEFFYIVSCCMIEFTFLSGYDIFLNADRNLSKEEA